MKNRVCLATLLGMILGAISTQAQGWGDLTATFQLDGSAPKPKSLTINKDEQVCGKFALVDESLVVNSGNNGIANVIVYLYVARAGKKPPIHDSYKATETEPVRLDNHQCRFEPHVSLLRTTQTLITGNKDTVGHNTNLSTLKNPPQNILIPAGGDLKLNFAMDEALPTTINCNIHPWMKGFVLIKDHPYFGVTDKDGKVTIKNVPAGKWTFQFWQEAAGYVVDVNFKGKPTKWERGRVELDIKAGANDLGVIKVAPSIFKLN